MTIVPIGYYDHCDILKVHDFLGTPANVKIFSPWLDEHNSSLSSHGDSQELPKYHRNIDISALSSLSPRFISAPRGSIKLFFDFFLFR